MVNQALATLAFFGVGVNLVLFLTRVLDEDTALAANSISKWTGTVYLFSLIGAFLSDSYWGCCITWTIFELIFVLGLGLLSLSLSLSSWLFLIKPVGCRIEIAPCMPTSFGISIFYLSIYLIAIGYGGHQPTLATFGADQYDEEIPKEKTSKEAFFCPFYFALNLGSLFSETILVQYEDKRMWTMGFLVSLASAVIALLSYWAGTPWYRYVKPSGYPVIRLAQVFVASCRKWKVVRSSEDQLYEVEGPASALKGRMKILQSNDLGFLNKAAMVTENDVIGPENPRRLCTITQVEEAKCVLRMIPIWLFTIIYSVVFTQMDSLFVKQGDVMNSYIDTFHLPAASLSAFDICIVLLCTELYHQILVPLAGKLSGKPKGLTQLQSIGTGLIIGMLAMIAAGATEVERLRQFIPGKKTSSLRIPWQIPQYLLVGASEVFMYVGQLEFFNGQAPEGITSFGTSLCMASISVGNYINSMLVNIVMGITAEEAIQGGFQIT